MPWGPDGTRQLTPIEIPPVVTANDCGPGCKQVTFLPGSRKCTTDGDAFSVNGDYLTTSMFFVPIWTDADGNKTRRCLQVYVDLRTLKAYAFGAIYSGPAYTACGSGSVNAGRVAYACNATRVTTSEVRSELRVFDITSSTERLLWGGDGVENLDQPKSLAFADTFLAQDASPGCYSGACSAVLLSPIAGGPREQLYPPPGEATGGISQVSASFPYLVFSDYQRYYTAGLGVEVLAIDLRQPNHVIDVSSQAADQWKPRISGTRVVWMDTRNDTGNNWSNYRNTDIYGKDLVTGQEFAVCTNPAQQDSPDIEGDLAVWMDCRNLSNPTPGQAYPPCADPYVRNLSGGSEQAVTVTLPSDYLRGNLRINGGRIFFQVGKMGEAMTNQIYMVDLLAAGLTP